MADEPEARDYLKEAMGIAAGTGRTIAEKAHVVALAAAQAKTIKEMEVVLQILAAFLLMGDPNAAHLAVPADVLKRVLDTRMQIYIGRTPDGGINVYNVRKREAVQAPPPKGVM